MCMMLLSLLCEEREFSDGERASIEGERGMHSFETTHDMGEGNDTGQ